MQTQVARVSIIVPTFNRAHYLGQCLESLIAQTVPAHEIIVVDDGSEDDTESVVARYVPQVTYLRKVNGGKASALNFGIARSTGNLIWVFDDDDAAFPDAIEHRLAIWRVDPAAGFVYGPHSIVMEGSDGILHQVGENWPSSYDNDTFFLYLLRDCFFHLNSCLFRRTVFDAVQGFDEHLKRAQDYDFQIRMVRAFRGVLATKPVFAFRRHDGLRGDQSTRHRAEERSNVFVTFDRLVGKKIRSELSLGEYLCPPRRSVLSSSERITALLSRMVVMGSKGYIEALSDDLVDAVQSMDALGIRMRESERELIRTAMCQGYSPVVIDQQWHVFVDCMRQLRSYKHGWQVRMELAKGLVRLARSYPNPWRFRLRILLRAVQIGTGLIR